MLSEIPVVANSISGGIEIECLSVPEISDKELCLLRPVNGLHLLLPLDNFSPEHLCSENLRIKLEVEKQWISECETDPLCGSSLSKRFIEAEIDLAAQFRIKDKIDEDPLCVPLGEQVLIGLTLRNRMPLDLSLSYLHIEMNPADNFLVDGVDVILHGGTQSKIELAVTPLELGLCSVKFAKWKLSDGLSVRQPLRKEGLLLHRTIHQRSNHVRGDSSFLTVDIVPSFPLVSMSIEGLSREILRDQIVQTTLILRNDGAASACCFDIKISHPCFVFFLSDTELISSGGPSCTIFRLPSRLVCILK